MFMVPNRLNQTLISTSGFSVEEFCFLAGILVLWYFVGQVLDQHKPLNTPTPAKATLGKSLRNFFLVVLGGWILYSGIDALRFPGRWNNSVGNIVEGVLFLAWSLVLT